MNGVVSLFTEVPRMSMQNIYDIGFVVLVANAMVAFLLNVSVVFLVSVFIRRVRTLTNTYRSARLLPSS